MTSTNIKDFIEYHGLYKDFYQLEKLLSVLTEKEEIGGFKITKTNTTEQFNISYKNKSCKFLIESNDHLSDSIRILKAEINDLEEMNDQFYELLKDQREGIRTKYLPIFELWKKYGDSYDQYKMLYLYLKNRSAFFWYSALDNNQLEFPFSIYHSEYSSDQRTFIEHNQLSGISLSFADKMDVSMIQFMLKESFPSHDINLDVEKIIERFKKSRRTEKQGSEGRSIDIKKI